MTSYISARTSFRVARYDADQVAWSKRTGLPVKPYMITVEHDCNLVTLAGWAAMLGGIAGTSISTKYSATAARIGIGSSVAAAVPGQTLLVSDTGGGSTTSYFQLVSAAPVITTGTSPATLVFTATFAGGVANFPWNEFGIDNGTVSGVTAQGLGLTLLNAGQSPQGTKPSGETWIATVTLNFGFPANVGVLS